MPDGGKVNWETNQFTSFRVASKDRQFTAEARHKGMTYRMGDYVHLINPDDPSRPIIGHVFKTYVSTKSAWTEPPPIHNLTLCSLQGSALSHALHLLVLPHRADCTHRRPHILRKRDLQEQ